MLALVGFYESEKPLLLSSLILRYFVDAGDGKYAGIDPKMVILTVSTYRRCLRSIKRICGMDRGEKEWF